MLLGIDEGSLLTTISGFGIAHLLNDYVPVDSSGSNMPTVVPLFNHYGKRRQEYEDGEIGLSGCPL